MSFIRYLTCFYSEDYMNGLIFDLVDILIESMPVHHDPWEVAFDKAVNIEFDQRTNYLLEGMRRIGLVKNIFELNTFGLKRFDESRATQITKSKYDLSKIFRFKFLERVSELVTNLVICTSKKDFESVLEQVLGFWEGAVSCYNYSRPGDERLASIYRRFQIINLREIRHLTFSRRCN